MKKIYYIFLLLLHPQLFAQITTPVINANFGVDADLQANYFNSAASSSGDDDWFSLGSNTGIGVIDTTGASSILSMYASNSSSRYASFYRGMSVPPFSTVNNKMLLGAAFIRDYHGNDSTSFSGSKNGDSPGNWYSPQSQPVPNKNDILDVMMHLRRDGPSNSDSLWLFAGVSFDATTGDRYYDFEMYQTNLSFDRASGTFSGYGPDAGHTSWTFDAAGNVVTPGDIIFSAHYGSSSLSSIEARIWINKSSLSISPAGFSWGDPTGTTDFDGATNAATYGYAVIVPKTTGNFYTGLENPSSTWAGAFSLVLGNNSVSTTYTTGQFMEFSVNLTKLGLDPNTMAGKTSCDMPFRRFMVKSRTSNSFTSQLKDFVAPVNFFQSVSNTAATDASATCGYTGPASVYVTDPVSSSVYTWTTSDGSIVTNPVSDSITVSSAGTYVVSQQLRSFCPVYATDTVVIKPFDAICSVLKIPVTGFAGSIDGNQSLLNWSVANNNEVSFFELEASSDGLGFSPVQKIFPTPGDANATYSYTDEGSLENQPTVFYRLKIVSINGGVSYSNAIRLYTGDIAASVKLFPNPVTDRLQINIHTAADQAADVMIFDGSGRLMQECHTTTVKGNSKLVLSDFANWPPGVYSVKVVTGNQLFIQKIVLRK